MAPLRPAHRKTQPSVGETNIFKVSNRQSSNVKQKKAKQAKRLIDSLADDQTTDVFINAKANDDDKARIGGLQTSEASRIDSTRWASIRDLFAKVPRSDRNITQKQINEACQAFSSPRAIQATKDTSRWRLRGVKTHLLLHQLLGVAWMRLREKGQGAPFGGIQGDQMGFGKTMQILSNVVDDLGIGQKPLTVAAKEARKGTTLYVTSNANLVIQVLEEFLEHCDSSKLERLGLIEAYHAGQRSNMKGKHLIHYLQRKCVIITTYSEVSKQFKQPAKAPPFETFQERVLREEKAQNQTGPFYQIVWRRVVLDEAHTIRNHNSHVFKACCALKSKFRWMMTATPVFNTPDEFYAYFRFLEVPEITTFRNFKKRFFDENLEDSTAKLRLELSNIMLSRTEQHTLLGTTLVPLQDCKVNTIFVDFSPFERKVYNKLDSEVDSAHETMARMIQEEDAISNDSNAIKHKALLKLMGLRLTTCHPLFVAHKALTQSSEMQKSLEHTAENSDLSPDEINEFLQNGAFSKTLSSDELLDMRSALQNLADDYAHRERACQERLLPEGDGQERKVLRKDIFRGGAYKYNTKRWMEMGFPIILSSKAQAVLNQILEWIFDDPSQKIVVYTQFLEMISIVEETLAQCNIGCEKYHGKMSPSSRFNALARFGDKVEKQVLIMSLSSGSFGLNLTCASRAIMVDLWWNGCTEAQAFGRLRRLGQKRVTEFVRFAVPDTIDQTLLDVQGIKYGMIIPVTNEKVAKMKTCPLEEVMKKQSPTFRQIEIIKGVATEEDDDEEDDDEEDDDEEDDDEEDDDEEDDDEEDDDEDNDDEEDDDEEDDDEDNDVEQEEGEQEEGDGDKDIEDVASTTSTDEWDFVDYIKDEDVSVHGEDHGEASVKEEN